MAQHKWHKEIHAWADGAQIQSLRHPKSEWLKDPCPRWAENVQYRIKPQPKEPQYLYVFLKEQYQYIISTKKPTLSSPYLGEYIGKIKLEESDK